MTRNARLAVAGLAALFLASGCGREESKPSPKPPPAATAGEAWRWTAPRQAGVGMPTADERGIAFTYGHNSVVLLSPDGREHWQSRHVGVRDVAPALTDDAIVAATDDGVVAFDRATGARLWQTAIGERANTPAVTGGRAVVSTWDGSLVGIDVASGAVLWRTPIGGGALGPAAASGDVAVTTWETERGTDAGATAVDVSSGAVRWTVALMPRGVSAPAIATAGAEPAVVVVVDGSLAARALDMGSGEERWQAGIEGAGSPEVPPLPLAEGDVLVAHRLGGVVLFNFEGVPLWSESSDGAAVRGGAAGPGDNGRFALPLDDGRVLLAGPDGDGEVLDPPGLVSAVGRGPGGELLVATDQAPPNVLMALGGW